MKTDHLRLPQESFELACGAELVVSPRADAPVCSIQVHLRGGHSLDPEGLEGTAFLTGRLCDQGTKEHSEEELAALLESHGGSLYGAANGISASIAGPRWKLLVDTLCEVVARPSYPRAKLDRERERLLDRLRIEDADPRSQASRLFRGLVYGDHWLGRAETGSPESVSRIRRADLVRFHKRNWCGRRTLIACCGDVDPGAVKRAFERGLASWNPGRELPPLEPKFPPLKPRTAAFRARRQQVHIYLGHLGVRRIDPDYPALVVMDHILGTGPGFTSRITRRLRDELGLAYTVQAAIHSSAGVLPGTFTAYIGTSPENTATSVRGFLEEIGRIQDELVEPKELELARSYLTGSFAMGFERASRRAQYLVVARRNGLPEDNLARLLKAFESVTREDVRRVARKHLHPRAACLAAAGPVSKKELAALLRERPASVR